MVIEILDIEESSLLEYTKKAIKEYVKTQIDNDLEKLDQ